MKHRLLLPVAVAAAAAAPAFAADYDYLEAHYTFAGDIVDVGDVTGFGLDASRSFNDWLFARASADFLGIDAGGDDDATLDLFAIGPGARVPVTAGQHPIDLYGSLNYQRVATGSVETGLSATVGAAMDVTRDLEGRVQYTGMDESDVTLKLYELRLAYDVDPDWAVTGSFMTGDAEADGSDRDPENLVRLGVRFQF